MKDWQEETASDLSDAESLLVNATTSVAGEPTDEQMRTIWLAYLKLEKSVAFIKVELDEENPGRFVNPSFYRVPDERQALLFALRSLKRGSEMFASGDLGGSLKDLRESRNYLRVLLKEKRRLKLKRARAARKA